MSSNKKNSFKKRYTKKSDNRSRKKYDRNNRSSGYMVRISNLPHDVTDHELKELVKFDYTDNNGKTIRCNWHILKCFVMNNKYGYSGMINFKFKNQADYVVESLDKTPFANQILKVEILPPR